MAFPQIPIGGKKNICVFGGGGRGLTRKRIGKQEF